MYLGVGYLYITFGRWVRESQESSVDSYQYIRGSKNSTYLQILIPFKLGGIAIEVMVSHLKCYCCITYMSDLTTYLL